MPHQDSTFLYTDPPSVLGEPKFPCNLLWCTCGLPLAGGLAELISALKAVVARSRWCPV